MSVFSYSTFEFACFLWFLIIACLRAVFLDAYVILTHCTHASMFHPRLYSWKLLISIPEILYVQLFDLICVHSVFIGDRGRMHQLTGENLQVLREKSV